MESASGGQTSDELEALGKLPSDAELRALIERYAGTARVTCELADEFLASVGEVVPARPQLDPELVAREVEEVAGGSWLEKIGSGSSAPPRARSVPAASDARAESGAPMPDARPRKSSIPPVLSITPVPPVPEPVPNAVSVQEALEHLPAATYSTMPPPSALPSQGSAPIALPLSSRPALAPLPPTAAEAESVLVEQWGPAASTPLDARASEPSAAAPFEARSSSRVPPLPQGAASLDARSSNLLPVPSSVGPEGAGSLDARSSSVLPLPRSGELPPPASLGAEGAWSLGARSSSLPPLPASVAPDAASAADARSSNTLPPTSSRPRPSSAVPRSPEEALLSAEEDALLDQWSEDLDKVLPSEPARQASSPPMAASRSDVAAASDEPEPWNAPDLGADRSAAVSSRPGSQSPLGPPSERPRPERDDDAPLSAAELSLLDRWSATDAPAAPSVAKPESAITGGFEAADYAAAVYAPSDSRFPRARTRSQPPRGGEQASSASPSLPAANRASPVPAPPPAITRQRSAPPAFPSGRPATQPSFRPAMPSPRPPVPAAALAASLRPPPLAAESGEPDVVDLDVEEIELEPDDLIEVDND